MSSCTRTAQCNTLWSVHPEGAIWTDYFSVFDRHCFWSHLYSVSCAIMMLFCISHCPPCSRFALAQALCRLFFCPSLDLTLALQRLLSCKGVACLCLVKDSTAAWPLLLPLGWNLHHKNSWFEDITKPDIPKRHLCIAWFRTYQQSIW